MEMETSNFFGWGESNFHFDFRRHGNALVLPKSNLYSILLFKSYCDSNSSHESNMLGDVAILILILIHYNSDSSCEPNAHLVEF